MSTEDEMRQGFELVGQIATERLILRAFAPGDFDAVFAMQSREDVALYLVWDARTQDEVRAALEKKIASTVLREDGDVLFLAVVLPDTGELVGDVVLQLLSTGHGQGEVGFIVHPDRGGHGYATEAAEVLLRIAFEELGLHRVIGQVESRNIASMRVLEKLGMRREAHFVENVFVKGAWQDELIYAILDHEWRASGG